MNLQSALAALALIQGGFGGLLFWVARLIYTGRLVPVRSLDRVEKEKEDIWTAYRIERQTNQELTNQVVSVMSVVRGVAS